MDVVDRAEQAVTLAQQAGLAGVHRALAAQGAADCVTCGDAIEPARRAALPSARRCHDCETKAERFWKGFAK